MEFEAQNWGRASQDIKEKVCQKRKIFLEEILGENKKTPKRFWISLQLLSILILRPFDWALNKPNEVQLIPNLDDWQLKGGGACELKVGQRFSRNQA